MSLWIIYWACLELYFFLTCVIIETELWQICYIAWKHVMSFFCINLKKKKIKNLFVVVASLVLCSLNLFAGFDPLSPRKYARKNFSCNWYKKTKMVVYLFTSPTICGETLVTQSRENWGSITILITWETPYKYKHILYNTYCWKKTLTSYTGECAIGDCLWNECFFMGLTTQLWI